MDILQRVVDRFARADQPKYTVWWENPDRGGKWDVYQSGLSRKSADALSKKVTYFLSVRWYNKNVPTKVLPEGATP